MVLCVLPRRRRHIYSLVGVGLVPVLDKLEDEATVAEVDGLEFLLLTNLHPNVWVGGQVVANIKRQRGKKAVESEAWQIAARNVATE